MTLRTDHPFCFASPEGQTDEEVIFVGIIDTLVPFRWRKRTEYWLKVCPRVCACVRASARVCGYVVCVTLVSVSAFVLPVLPAQFSSVFKMNACVHVYISTHA